jgi:hypothetical protein
MEEEVTVHDSGNTEQGHDGDCSGHDGAGAAALGLGGARGKNCVSCGGAARRRRGGAATARDKEEA